MPTSTSLHLAQNLCISLLDFFLKKVCILVAAVFLTLPMGALLRRCLAGEEEREFPLFLCLGRKEGEGERQASKKRRPLRHNRIWRKTSWVKYETFTLRGMVSANCQAHFLLRRRKVRKRTLWILQYGASNLFYSKPNISNLGLFCFFSITFPPSLLVFVASSTVLYAQDRCRYSPLSLIFYF